MEKENKLDETRREIRQRTIEFRELEPLKIYEGLGVKEKMKMDNYNKWLKLMNQIDSIAD